MVTAGVLTATILGGGIFASMASAASNNSDDSLAAKIANKFNLNKDEVQTVLNEHHQEVSAEHKAEMQTRLEQRLSKAVSDGKITEDQKTKIIDYLKTQETFFESLKDKTAEERKSAITAHKAEVQKWASDNGIDQQYVLFGGGHDGHMGP